jgi:hypothetical protein
VIPWAQAADKGLADMSTKGMTAMGDPLPGMKRPFSALTDDEGLSSFPLERNTGT